MSWQQDGEQQVQFQYGAATIQDEICLSPHFDGRHTRLEAKLGIKKMQEAFSKNCFIKPEIMVTPLAKKAHYWKNE